MRTKIIWKYIVIPPKRVMEAIKRVIYFIVQSIRPESDRAGSEVSITMYIVGENNGDDSCVKVRRNAIKRKSIIWHWHIMRGIPLEWTRSAIECKVEAISVLSRWNCPHISRSILIMHRGLEELERSRYCR